MNKLTVEELRDIITEFDNCDIVAYDEPITITVEVLHDMLCIVKNALPK